MSLLPPYDPVRVRWMSSPIRGRWFLRIAAPGGYLEAQTGAPRELAAELPEYDAAGAQVLRRLQTQAPVGWIDMVEVETPHRNRSLGAALVRQALAEFAAAGVHDVYLAAHDAETGTAPSPGLIGFYARLGFEVVESSREHEHEREVMRARLP